MEPRVSRPMSLRALATFAVLLSCVWLIVTGTLLYLKPAFMRQLSPYRHAWSDLHIAVSIVLIVAAIVHLFCNWGALKAYLTRRSGGSGVRWRELATVTACLCLVTFAVFAGFCRLSDLVDHGGPPPGVGERLGRGDGPPRGGSLPPNALERPGRQPDADPLRRGAD
ncbi:MAG TPA: DUF4405 domain-containing protein [Chthonomonadales bacterium]|nr:DUF4405 domain-containing protein [Chthonomonadales bacterium]